MVRIAYLAEQTRITTVSKITNPKILHEKPNENKEHMQTHVIFRWSSKKPPGPDTLKTATQTSDEAVNEMLSTISWASILKNITCPHARKVTSLYSGL